jgi:hypothetical protein
MSDTDKSIAVILILLLSLFNFMLGLMIGIEENPCDKNETHQTIFIDETGQIYRINNRLPDTTRLMQMPRDVEQVQVLRRRSNRATIQTTNRINK